MIENDSDVVVLPVELSLNERVIQEQLDKKQLSKREEAQKVKAQAIQQETDLKVIVEKEIQIEKGKIEPFKPTNLSGDDFEYLLKGTPLKGFGYAFKEMEETYGINGLYAMGIANLESGLGTSSLAKTNNNLFGMKGKSYFTGKSKKGYQFFNSKAQSILAFGKLMKEKYTNLPIHKIAKIYCPPNHQNWIAMLNSGYSRFLSSLKMIKPEYFK